LIIFRWLDCAKTIYCALLSNRNTGLSTNPIKSNYWDDIIKVVTFIVTYADPALGDSCKSFHCPFESLLFNTTENGHSYKLWGKSEYGLIK